MFDGTNLLTVFLTGLLTGGLTCIAIQGGLMATTILPDPKDQKQKTALGITKKKFDFKNNKDLLPLSAFLIARLIAYTLLGLALGWIGSLFQVSIQTRIVFQFLVVIFMLGTALNLLNVHPIFEIFAIKPPRFIANFAYKNAESKNVFAPALVGFLTVLIPCGATQAMMALAVGSGNIISGAVIMFTFILGTSPLFFILGFLTLRLGMILKREFLKIAAVALILLALFNLDATLALANSPVTISSLVKGGYCIVSYCLDEYSMEPVSQQTITFTNTGYSPNFFVINKGTSVTLHLVNKNAVGCIQAFTMSALNIQKIVQPNQSADLTFTAPDKPGRITFTCSAGLYPGTIEVI